jgi:hypothetical protein
MDYFGEMYISFGADDLTIQQIITLSSNRSFYLND